MRREKRRTSSEKKDGGGLEDHMGLARCSKAFGFNTIMIYTKIKVKLL